MSETSRPSYSLFISSIIIALFLEVVPLPTWAIWLRPEFVPLVVLYWVMTFPSRFNIGIAWCLGLLLDALNGTLLGEHALALTTIAFMMGRWQRRMVLFPSWQTTLIIGVFITIYTVLLLIIQGAIRQPPSSVASLYPILTSTLVWPVIDAFLTSRRTRRKRQYDALEGE